MEKRKMIRVNIMITEKNKEKLDRMREETGLSASDLIRRMIDAVNEEPMGHEDSFGTPN
jgi:predicted CopG family antitoxin